MSTLAEAPGGEVVLYEAPDGEVRVDVRLDHESVWLTQIQMVDLFGRDQSVIFRHLRNVFADGELPTEGNMQEMHIASAEKPALAEFHAVAALRESPVPKLLCDQFMVPKPLQLRGISHAPTN